MNEASDILISSDAVMPSAAAIRSKDLFSLRPYYEDQWVKLYHADSYEVNLPPCDLMLTDPPYEMAMGGGGIGGKRQYTHDIKNGKLHEGFDMELLAKHPNWICFCAKSQLSKLLAACGDRRWSLVTWNKPNPTPLVNGNYLPDTEYIVHAFQSGRLFGEYRDRSRYIVHPVEQNGYDHPTVKPLAVVSKMVRLGSQPGEMILDPFCGTGTTLLAAKLCGRRAIGVEREEKHCETAANRCAQDCLALGG